MSMVVNFVGNNFKDFSMAHPPFNINILYILIYKVIYKKKPSFLAYPILKFLK